MAKMTLQSVREILQRWNDDAAVADIAMYADAYMDYQEAVENIRKNGNIVLHPRTGAPVDNPYASVKKRAIDTMRKFRSIFAPEELWEIDAEADAVEGDGG